MQNNRNKMSDNKNNTFTSFYLAGDKAKNGLVKMPPTNIDKSAVLPPPPPKPKPAKG
jgi:hypothetical protein